ncbi:MAG: chromosomal replication initiator protein DnaA [Candidatus Eremiobacteraeota bacterium]|nr:chromosomal replication initiator protein DnaA [Candidatus Eremiobacteraeota bacterium]
MNESVKSPDIELLWKECLKILENSVEKPTFEMCLKDVKPLSLEKNTFTIGVTPFAKNLLKRKSECKKLITDTLSGLSGERYTLSITAMEPQGNGSTKEEPHGLLQAPQASPSRELQQPAPQAFFLNPRYTFDTFVVGNSNNFAWSACRAVSDSPGSSYNPLFIYGGVGLGKTHLLQAIGNEIMGTRNTLNVFYISTEKFASELIRCLEERKMVQFKDKYRNVDVLLIDDIQFLIGKERTQDEFFHTFNALHDERKQIVLTSDRPPKEIPTLSDRLRSRFEWGLIADIQSPDIETREAILRRKADSEKIKVPLEVIAFIAEKITSNIRELEGALIRVVAYASFHKKNIDLQIAQDALKSILPDTQDRFLTPEIIQKKVAEYFGIKATDIISIRRDQRFAYPRHIAMYLTKELTNLSYPDTAKAFGKKDHSTVIHAYNKVTGLLDDPSTKNNIENIKNQLKDRS